MLIDIIDYTGWRSEWIKQNTADDKLWDSFSSSRPGIPLFSKPVVSSIDGKEKGENQRAGQDMVMPFFCFSLSILHCPRVGRKNWVKLRLKVSGIHGVMKTQPGCLQTNFLFFSTQLDYISQPPFSVVYDHGTAFWLKACKWKWCMQFPALLTNTS